MTSRHVVWYRYQYHLACGIVVSGIIAMDGIVLTLALIAEIRDVTIVIIVQI